MNRWSQFTLIVAFVVCPLLIASNHADGQQPNPSTSKRFDNKAQGRERSERTLRWNREQHANPAGVAQPRDPLKNRHESIVEPFQGSRRILITRPRVARLRR